MSGPNPSCPRQITGYHLDDEGHWVAQLSCGHNQHVRHDPPWEQRPWVLSPNGRDTMLGFELNSDSERELCVNSGGPRKERVREFGTDFSHRRVQP
jgi:hypothetical protein